MAMFNSYVSHSQRISFCSDKRCPKDSQAHEAPSILTEHLAMADMWRCAEMDAGLRGLLWPEMKNDFPKRASSKPTDDSGKFLRVILEYQRDLDGKCQHWAPQVMQFVWVDLDIFLGLFTNLLPKNSAEVPTRLDNWSLRWCVDTSAEAQKRHL